MKKLLLSAMFFAACLCFNLAVPTQAWAQGPTPGSYYSTDCYGSPPADPGGVLTQPASTCVGGALTNPGFSGNNVGLPTTEYIITDPNTIVCDGNGTVCGPSVMGADIDGSFDPAAAFGLTDGDEFCVTAISYNLTQVQNAIDDILNNSVFGQSCCSAVQSISGGTDVCAELNAMGINSGADVQSFAVIIPLIQAFGGDAAVEIIVDVIENTLNDPATVPSTPCTEELPLCYAISSNNICYTYHSAGEDCLGVCGGSTVTDCMGVCGGTTLPGTACDDGDPCTNGDAYDANCNCVGNAIPDSDSDGLCDAIDPCPNLANLAPGDACDDGDACTVLDEVDANCNCVGIQVPDSDSDGLCDAIDPCPNLANLAPGDACDDGDATTGGDTVDANCDCIGLPLDCEGTPGGTATAGTTCDDGDPTTGNDTWDANCNCVGLPLDCEGTPGGTATSGTTCDDGDPTTGNDTWDANCNCVGLPLDCEGTPGGTATVGTACDDGNANTSNDMWDANCNCVGELPNDCEGTPGGTAQPGTACDDGDATTGNDTWDANCNCVGLPLDCEGTPGGTAVEGAACDDGDPTTGGDTWDANCNCVGLPLDCEGTPGGTATVGTACDDGNANTSNDTWDANCNCVGELPADCEGTPGGTAQPGTACDDGDATTGNDTWQTDCTCVGELIDCEGTPGGTAVEGAACDDGDPTTTNDMWNANCECVGTAQTVDCEGTPGGTALPGTACDDGDANTINDTWNANCVCEGTAGGLVINEVDYDQPGFDQAEFVELYNGGAAAIDLTGYAVELINGSNGSAYLNIPLNSVSLAPGDYYVICGNAGLVANCDQVEAIADNMIQNGAPDAVALLDGAGGLIDAVSYEGDVAGYVEGSGAGLMDDGANGEDGRGISRFPDGNDTDSNNTDFVYACATPGAANVGDVSTCLPLDCEGTPGGTATPGTTCDDGDANTEDDVYQADCTCAGTPVAAGNIVINEIDYDQPGTDAAEFIELYNAGATAVDLSAYTIELINGSGPANYGSIVLNPVLLAPGDYYVICGDNTTVANCDQVAAPATNLIQNGPDAVVLELAGVAVDAVSYEGTIAGYGEGTGTSAEDNNTDVGVGISRYPDGADTNDNDTDFVLACSTPGAANVADVASCAAAPDCEGTPGGTALPGTACDDGDATTGNDMWDANCNCVGQLLDCEGTPGGTALPGTACDDGDATTGNDTWQTDCSCVGEALDCEGTPGGTALPGTACDDGDATTGNDMWDANCNCVGQAVDCEGTPGGTALPGTACDDGDATTGNDMWDANCNCAGETIDCEGTPGGTALPGTACDDGDATTGSDMWDANCNCAGMALDCEGTPGGSVGPGSPCDDGNASSINDAYDANCNCVGQIQGCTDSSADNYNANATIDDGSCAYSGCTDPAAINYNPNATTDDGSCIYAPCTVPITPTVTNYASAYSAYQYTGYTLALGGTSPYSYNWGTDGYVRFAYTTSMITVIAGNTATFTVTITDAQGCISIFTSASNSGSAVEITAYDVTAATSSTATNGGVNISVGGGTTPYTYAWSNGSTNQDLTGVASGWYIVTVTDSGGNTDVGAYWVPVNSGGGSTSGGFTRNKLALAADGSFLTAYPNPFDRTTTVEFAVTEATEASVEVFGLAGNRVASLFNGELEANTDKVVEFDAASLPAGVYIVRFATNSGIVKHHKIVLAK